MAGRDPMTDSRRTLLILGGTGDALRLAHAAEEKWGSELRVIYSLAGVTRNPAKAGGEIRIGGFGGDGAHFAQHLNRDNQTGAHNTRKRSGKRHQSQH